MKVISKMKQYIVNFPQLIMKASIENIHSRIKKYLSRLKTHVTDLNRRYKLIIYSFNKEYLTCKNQLTKYNKECHSPSETLKSQLKYNKKYIKNLNIIDNSLDETLAKHYKSKISSIMDDLKGTCQRNTIMNTYKKINIKLKCHFDILAETKNSKIKLIKKDSLAQKIIVRMHHHYSYFILILVRIPKKTKNSNRTKTTVAKIRYKKKKLLKKIQKQHKYVRTHHHISKI